MERDNLWKENRSLTKILQHDPKVQLKKLCGLLPQNPHSFTVAHCATCFRGLQLMSNNWLHFILTNKYSTNSIGKKLRIRICCYLCMLTKLL